MSFVNCVVTILFGLLVIKNAQAIRIDECTGDNIRMMVSLQGVTGQPTIHFQLDKSVWSLSGKKNIQVNPKIEESEFYLKASSKHRRNFLLLQFSIPMLKDLLLPASLKYSRKIYAKVGRHKHQFNVRCIASEIIF